MLASPIPGAATVARVERVEWIDQLRGLAVALMVLDHVLVQLDPGNVLRVTLTRFSLPLFMVCAALVWRAPTGRRLLVLGGVAVLEVALGAVLGMAVPGIVLLFVVLVLVVGAVGVDSIDAVAGPVLVVALLQALYVPVGWRGYEPGLVLAWFVVGRLAGGHFARWGERVPSGFGSIGRRPLVWYVGHLAALVPVAVLGA